MSLTLSAACESQWLLRCIALALLQEQALVLVSEPLTDATGGDAAVSCSHSHAASLLAALDVDRDGAASRRDMLLAFRRDRQLAGEHTHTLPAGAA
jgi:hypothetical protein